MECKMLLFIALITTSSKITTDSDYVAPGNVTAVQGSGAEFRCQPNSSSDVYSWEFRPFGTAEDVVIYLYSSGVGVNKEMTTYDVRNLSDGSIDLIINSTQLNHAGLYSCMIRVKIVEEGAVTIIPLTAQLVVLENEPTCETTSEIRKNEWLEIQCTVSYRGNSAPAMEWRKNDEYNESIISDKVENSTVSNGTLTSTLRLLVRNDGVNYTCMVHFNDNFQFDYDGKKTTINICTWTSHLPKKSPAASTMSPHNNSYALIALAIFVAALSAFLVFLLIKWRVNRKDKNSVHVGEEPPGVDLNDYLQDVCQYEEIADCEEADALQPSQSKQADQGIEQTLNSDEGRSPTTMKNLTRVHINGKTRFVGEDGTEYLDMNGLEERKQNTKPTEKPFYSVSQYAMIDHSVGVFDLQPQS